MSLTLSYIISSFSSPQSSENATPDQMNDFLEEINLMKAVGSHKNIVSLIGCCTKSTPNFLIVEFASKGDLLSYLRERRKKVTLWYTLNLSNMTYECLWSILKKREKQRIGRGWNTSWNNRCLYSDFQIANNGGQSFKQPNSELTYLF